MKDRHKTASGQDPTPEVLAAKAAQRLLDGLPLNGTRAAQCGPYAEHIDALDKARERGGKSEVRAVFKAPLFAELRQLVAGYTEREDPLAALGIFTAAELEREELPDPTWIVPDVLPEGASILAAKPKVGKSLLALNIALAVATGGRALGKVPVEAGRVLFLALEGGKHGLKRRLDTMLRGEPWPNTLHFARDWKRLDDGGLKDLRAFLEAYPDTRFVVVDTLKKVRARTNGRRNAYDEDYESLEGLVGLGVEYGVSILVIHHTRKGSSDDPIDEISGSTGLTGAVDNVLVLQKERGQIGARLVVIPREEEENEFALTFDEQLATWTLAGKAEDFAKTQERQQILDVLREAGEPMRPRDVADVLSIKPGNVSFLLSKMLKEGMVERPKYGYYTATSARSAISTQSATSAITSSDSPAQEGEGGSSYSTSSSYSTTAEVGEGV